MRRTRHGSVSTNAESRRCSRTESSVVPVPTVVVTRPRRIRRSLAIPLPFPAGGPASSAAELSTSRREALLAFGPVMGPPTQNPLWGPDWLQVRAMWPIDPAIAHLNHGSFGAVPVPVIEAQDRWRRKVESDPTGFFWWVLPDALLAGVTERTRIAVVDHIASPTAMVFPVGHIVRRLREVGVLSFVDGAHAPGMVDVNLGSLAPDFWTGNFHKWCCAPRGAAGLYVAPEHRERIVPLVTSWNAP